MSTTTAVAANLKRLKNGMVRTVLPNHWEIPDIDSLVSSKSIEDVAGINEYPIDPVELREVLASYGVSAKIADIHLGPSITTYALELPRGARSTALINRRDDLARDLAQPSLRVIPQIQGTAHMGLEVENNVKELVSFAEVIRDMPDKGALPFVVGKDALGRPMWLDLAKMPHLLVAGTTGSGKSVFLNAMISSFICRFTPKEVRFIMIDPKAVEFAPYTNLPHMEKPLATTVMGANEVLGHAIEEMERRLLLIRDEGVKDIKSYNKLVKEGKRMPYLVCIVDEFADLMLSDKEEAKNFEEKVIRIAQKARAAGIHLVIATQKPIVKVVTSLIKGNMPSRIAFRVASSMDSKVILDETGAERLLGRGDMLISTTEVQGLRAQGAWISDDDVHTLVSTG